MRLHRAPCASAIAVITGLALHCVPAVAQIQWVIQTADPAQGSGWTTSLRLSPTGLPRVAEWQPGAVRYASYDGSSWSVETVPPASGAVTSATPAPDLGRDRASPARTDLLITTATALALDASDDPWIVSAVTDLLHVGPSPIPLSVAHRAGGSWTVENIGSGFGKPSVEFDASGRLHLCFDAGTPPGPGLEYGSRSAEVWSYETIDADGSAGVLKLDGQGVPHVLYWDPARSALVHASRSGPGAWDTTTVPTPAGVGAYALALGSDGRPRVAVACGQGTPEPALLYLERQPDGSWTSEVAENSAGLKADVSLALDPAGDPVIAHSDQAAPGLVIAVRHGGAWTSQTVEAGNSGYYSSIALDGAGRPVVSFRSDLGPVVMHVAFGSSVAGALLGPTPDVLHLYSVRPNPLPAGRPLALTLALPADARVGLEAFDVCGRRVAASGPHAVSAGMTTLTWDAAPRSPGLYFIRAFTSDWQAIAKLVVTR